MQNYFNHFCVLIVSLVKLILRLGPFQTKGYRLPSITSHDENRDVDPSDGRWDPHRQPAYHQWTRGRGEESAGKAA